MAKPATSPAAVLAPSRASRVAVTDSWMLTPGRPWSAGRMISIVIIAARISPIGRSSPSSLAIVASASSTA
jgi:hypothetical protein